jgi:cytochrome c2
VSAAFGAASEVAEGKTVFAQCQVCHSAVTPDKKVGPSLKGLFHRAKLVNGKPVTDKAVRSVIDAGGNGMPAYEKILSDKQKDQVIAYLKTL